MTAPLSSVQQSNQNLATGMFGSQRQVIAPRGAYVAQGVGDPNLGYVGEGFYWNDYPALLSGKSGFADVSTETGTTVGTPIPKNEQKVGGGEASAQVPDYGGTAAY